ncbi:MAG: DUF5615 family PIN-like protein [candidate division WOR-3 bacterium]|nr:DUF5615 family PIN-like protein [candidate division WOR-3 bacterium]
MKFKLDENFGKSIQILFESQGLDVVTVRSQNIQGCSDQYLYDVCCKEERCLVTLDLDFADTVRFPLNKTSGIIVIRIPKHSSIKLLKQLIFQLLSNLKNIDIKEKLWIVEPGRIRIHESKASTID